MGNRFLNKKGKERESTAGRKERQKKKDKKKEVGRQERKKGEGRKWGRSINRESVGLIRGWQFLERDRKKKKQKKRERRKKAKPEK